MFTKAYGKHYKKIEFDFSNQIIYTYVYYETESDQHPQEAIGLKIWIKDDENIISQKQTEPQLILWKDNIYTNPLLMPDKQAQHHFYQVREQFIDCPADKLVGHYKIELDNKLIERLFKINFENICSETKNLIPTTCPIKKDGSLNSSYDYNRSHLPVYLNMEKYLLEEIKKRKIYQQEHVRKTLFQPPRLHQ